MRMKRAAACVAAALAVALIGCVPPPEPDVVVTRAPDRPPRKHVEKVHDDFFLTYGDDVASKKSGLHSAPALPQVSAAEGPGFATWLDGTRVLDRYDVRLVTTDTLNGDELERLREPIRRVLGDISFVTGVRFNLLPGAIDNNLQERNPEIGEIWIGGSLTSELCGPMPSWDACAEVPLERRETPSGEARWVSGGGKILLRPQVWTEFDANQRQNTLAHEFGHIMGLNHYNRDFGGQRQVMFQFVSDIPNYQLGDMAGLKHVAQDIQVRTTPLHQYYSAAWHDHFYTVWRNDAALAAMGYTYQGCIASVNTMNMLGTVELQRWWSDYFTDHLYTSIGGNWPAQFGYKRDQFTFGSEGFVYPVNAAQAGTVPLHRYHRASANPNEADHYYTTTRNDRDLAAFGYQYQRVEAQVLPPPPGKCT